MSIKKFSFLALCLVFLLSISKTPLLAQTTNTSGSVNVLSENSSNRIAPGDFLPISVKLVNFGSERRIDVTINYKVFDNADKELYLQREVYSESETMAVETTASFVKRIQVPYQFKPGLYTVVTVLNYPYQEQPAVSKFPFLVEEKIGGFFKSDLLIYSFFVLLVIAVVILITYFFTSWKRKQIISITSHDYNNKPKDQIIYYEILANIIAQMRLRIGNSAIEIAQDLPNLKIDLNSGFVINIGEDPAKIVALLITRYEKLLGKPISFSLREISKK